MSFRSLTLLFSLCSLAVSAQQQEGLETIVVTAKRQESQLSEVIGNISQLDAEALDDISAIHINEALIRIPGSWISRGNGQESLIAIRSPVLTGAGGCGPFFIAEDGISARAPGFCNVNQLFDLNSEQAGAIEVVRGPSSSLYGSNAVHGSINVITPDLFAQSQDSLALEAGPHDYFRGKVALSTGDQDSAFGVFANLASDGGFKDESGFDQQKVNLIHQQRWQDWDIKSVLSATNLNQETAGFVEGFEAFRDPALRRFNPNPEAFRDTQSVRAHSRIRHQLSDSQQLTLTPYLRWTDMRFIQHFVPWQPIEDTGHRSLGLQSQYQQDFGVWQLTTGLDLDYTQGFLREEQFQPFSPTIPEGLHYDYDVIAKIVSPFVNADWQLSERLNLNLGLRYDYTRYEYSNRLEDGDACAPGVQGCRFTRPASQDVSYGRFSPTLGLNYALAANHQLYGQLSQGFRAPQTTELFRLQAGQQTADLDAERLDALEVGARGQYQGLFYQVALFTQQKRNFIFQDTQRQNVSNGETDHHGIEWDLRYDFNPAWFVAFSGTLARHTYANNIQISNVNIDGNDIDTAPREITNLRLGWQPTQTLRAELEWVHLGDYFLNPENTARYEGHDLINLRAHWQASQHWQLSARWLNVTDEEYAERADFAFGDFRYFVGEPGSLYVQAVYQFN